MKQMRQGDVLLVRKRSLPKGERKSIARVAGRVILAEGEATGHAHAIAAPGANLFEIAGRVYLSIGADTVTLDHEEHSPITIEPGDYEVIRQREYAPEAIKYVTD